MTKLFNRLTCLIVLGVCITTALPILAAISLAETQGEQAERTYISDVARRALVRSEIIGDQLAAASREIKTLAPAEACGPKGIKLLRQIDLRSTMLQAVGWAEGSTMRCSSFTGNEPFELGPADLASANGSLFRLHVPLVDPQASYLAVQMKHTVAIVHRDLPMSYFDDDVPDLAIGVFSWSHRTPLISRGKLPAELFRRPFKGSTVFRYHGGLAAVVKSDRYDIAALAVLPSGNGPTYAKQAAMVLIPMGILVGLILSALLIHVVRNRASMPMMLRSALKQRRLYLVYQPVVELGSGRIVGAEALIRWDRGLAGEIPPDVFIPAAEQCGLIPLVTRRMLELLAEDACEILAHAPHFGLGVNFSASDMHRESILDEVERLFERSGLSPANLRIEATEQSLVDVERARDIMDRLHAKGVRIGIDDFGTGYSSLAYLAQLEVDFLKIDKLFIQSLGTGSATSQVAGRILDMARDLKLRIVAEGIENKRQERLVRDLGVEFAQGFLYGRPMRLPELLLRLEAEGSVPIPGPRRKAA